MRVTLIILAAVLSVLVITSSESIVRSIYDARSEEQLLRECLERIDTGNAYAVGGCHGYAEGIVEGRNAARLFQVVLVAIASLYVVLSIVSVVKRELRMMRNIFIACCIPGISPFVVLGIPFGIAGLIVYSIQRRKLPDYKDSAIDSQG